MKFEGFPWPETSIESRQRVAILGHVPDQVRRSFYRNGCLAADGAEPGAAGGLRLSKNICMLAL
jgi:hypothetical protein